MASQTPQPGVIKFESSGMTNASSNTPVAGAQQQCRHHLVHRDAAVAATENMAQDPHSTQVHNTARSNNKNQHAIGWELLHIDIEGGQVTI
jgi:hypothetical protein